MADHRYHWILLVDWALPHARAGMRVNVSKNLETVLPAVPPKSCVSGGVKGDSTGLIGVRIQIVIADELRYRPPLAVLRGKQERSAFALSTATTPQLKNQSRPE